MFKHLGPDILLNGAAIGGLHLLAGIDTAIAKKQSIRK